MPSLNLKPQPFKPRKNVEINWDDFSGGWNNIFRPTELKAEELAEATNCMLTGKGVPTGRWGSADYYLAGETQVRGFGHYDKADGSQVETLAVTDDGYLTKKSGASYSIVTGASFASGYYAEMAQLGDEVFIVGGNRELTKYDGTSLINYATLAVPTGVTATNISGASGTTTYSWRVDALSNSGGQTLASEAIQLSNLPFDLTDTLIKLNWNAVSAASGVLRGYQVYRGSQGNETYIASVDNTTTTIFDNGLPQSDIIFPATSDTTGGPKAKYVLKFDDRIVLAGFPDDPSLVMISGRYPYHDRFNWTYGGGFLRVSPDDGEVITGIGVTGSNVKGGSVPASILVFKENSSYAVVVKQVSIGNYSVLDPQFQKLAPVGTLSNKAVVEVENDTFFLDRKGIYSIGSEPNFLNEIRSREISSRIRPYIRNLTTANLQEATAAYIDTKYLLSFPSLKETIIYDYERRAFMGPWKTPWGITSWLRFIDSNGEEKWLAGATNGYIKEFSASLTTDSGTHIAKTIRTRKEDFGDWSLMKVIKLFYVLFRNVRGNVTIDIRLEDRSGSTVTSKTFNITGSTGIGGYGIDQYGVNQYGLTSTTVSLTGEEIIRWTQLYKTARVMQIEVKTTAGQSNFEFLGIRTQAQPMSAGGLNPSTRV